MSIDVSYIQPFGVKVRPQRAGVRVNDLEINLLRKFVREHHLIVLRGFERFLDSSELTKYCRLWGDISVWPFGEVLELMEHANPEDHIFDHNYVPLHWDGMYRKQVPELQIFHCVSAPDSEREGRTTFSNTAMVLKRVSSVERSLWSQATVAYSRKMEYYESCTEAPIICKHPYRDYSVIRYCEPTDPHDKNFVNHPNIMFKGVAESEQTHIQDSLRRSLYDGRNFYAHTWKAGDIVIADNYTLLHGREEFTSGSARHLRRVHILADPPLDNPHLVHSI